MIYPVSAASQETLSSGFPTSSDTNQAVQSQKIGLKFLSEEEVALYYVAKTKALICA